MKQKKHLLIYIFKYINISIYSPPAPLIKGNSAGLNDIKQSAVGLDRENFGGPIRPAELPLIRGGKVSK